MSGDLRPTRWRCDECEAVMTNGEIVEVRDPLPGSDRVWSVCPRCRAAEQWTNLCDEEGCDNRATCGWPSPEGYRRTCSLHNWRKL